MADVWLDQFPRRKSPNYGSRLNRKPQVIVLHSTGGSYGSALGWLTAKQSKVSAHFVVSREGKIAQLVALNKAAWHAGTSLWDGKKDVNNRSIGIEMEHVDGRDDWPEAQIHAVAGLVETLREAYGEIPVTSHAAVARPVGRKVDPEGFPWQELSQAVSQMEEHN